MTNQELIDKLKKLPPGATVCTSESGRFEDIKPNNFVYGFFNENGTTIVLSESNFNRKKKHTP